MPIYEYACEKCGKVIDVMQKISDPAPAKCEACGAEGPLSRMVSRTSFVLKGGGWYSDLYGSTKKDGGGGGSTTTPAASSATTSSTGTPATAATTTATSSPTPATPAASTGTKT